MAIFRKIHVLFWRDSFIEKLTPEQRYFYLYLMTNECSKQCGIYELTIKKMCNDTGYNSETVKKLLKFFIENNKIQYSEETEEIAIKNWLKYNDSNSPKVRACIEKELKEVKNRVLIQYLYSMDTQSQEEQEQEQEPEKIKTEEWFIVFWKEYPKKKAKETAEQKFYKVCKDEKTFQEMMAALKIQKQTNDWLKENGQFIPYPTTWLNQKRWEDEVTNISRPTNNSEVAYL